MQKGGVVSNKLYRHKGNGEIYEKVELKILKNCTIKQNSNNEWEYPVTYFNVKTLQPHITGEERFEPIEEAEL
jgi:hypothetical protein